MKGTLGWKVYALLIDSSSISFLREFSVFTCMFELFFVPKWFYGIDAILEGIVVIVALLIAGYAYKVYKKLDERKFKFFSLAFLLIALSFLAKIFTHLVIVSQKIRDLAVGTMQISLANTNVSDLFYRFGFFFHIGLFLTALLLLFLVSEKTLHQKEPLNMKMVLLALFFTFLITVFSNLKYLLILDLGIATITFPSVGFFYLTSLALMVMITFNYSKNYLKKKTNSTLLVAAAFILLALSQLIFLFDFVDTGFYIGGVIVELIGYLTLLAAFIMVLKK